MGIGDLFKPKQKQACLVWGDDRVIRSVDLQVEHGYLVNHDKKMAWLNHHRLMTPYKVKKGSNGQLVALLSERDALPIDVFNIVTKKEREVLSDPAPYASETLFRVEEQSAKDRARTMTSYAFIIGIATLAIIVMVGGMLVMLDKCTMSSFPSLPGIGG